MTDESSKGKAPAQDMEISMEKLNSFSLEHDNLVLSISDPVYTKRLTALMNAGKDRRLLEGIGNNLMPSAGLVFQQLESVQLVEDELKDARTLLDRLRQENDQVHNALGTKRLKLFP